MNIDNNDFYSLSTLLSSPKDRDHVVAFDRGKHIRWSQFLFDIAQLRDRLRQHNAHHIALCSNNSYLFAVGFFAVCHANKYLVLPGNYQPAALAELSPYFELLLCDETIHHTHLTDSLLLEHSQHPSSLIEFPTLDLTQHSVTLFTSGSSGIPKAIIKTLHQLDVEIAILEKLWGAVLQDSKIESTVSHQHIYGLLFRLLWPLCSGRAFAIYNLEFPEQVIAHAQPNTTLISSPALLKRLTQEEHAKPMCAVFSSGGPLSYSASCHADTLFHQRPIEVYGSTETGGIAYRQQHNEMQPWQLFPSIDAQLNHENCLALRSAHIDPNGWYQTADECEFTDTRHFILKGRTDRIIKIEEKRVSLVEVEKRLEQLAWIVESAVLPLQDGERLILVAALVLSPEGEAKLAELGKGKLWLLLRSELRQWLEPIALPRRFRVVKEIPLNSQGKRLMTELVTLFQPS
ncbi:acyl-CoA synthetase [Vibrio aestuarianus]|uniref:AMP-binding protein n=1 Tax=Vibrio aestuarianus TaxID=28171 RepID=UPI001558459F|nr:AMP-binding protein [Vibrio aestuarianus]NGZ14612.1 acyl-CoA synthetase [Vibrio aestuarianus]NKZ50760.1 acyl-CoA synthetase [Vibrio aestuarianus]